MKIKQRKTLSPAQKEAARKLWNKVYPKSLGLDDMSDFDNYLAGLTDPRFMIVTDEKDCLIGLYMDFIREEEKWFAILLDEQLQGKGFGKKLLELAKAKEPELNGWVIDHGNALKLNGGTYRSPLAFYLKNGFSVLPDIRLETDAISAVKIHWKKPMH